MMLKFSIKMNILLDFYVLYIVLLLKSIFEEIQIQNPEFFDY